MPSWFPSDLAELVVFAPARLVMLLLVAITVRWLLHRLIDRAVRHAIDRPARWRAAMALESASGLPTQRRRQRLRALGSLAKSIVTVFILVVVSATGLAELGFNVATLVASTSVVAAALAFGAQSMIKDLMSGIFMLVEDQLGVGDYVDMQLAAGTVEEIGLRITQLRADDGTIWYVRNGEVLRLANFSKGGPDRPAPGVQNLAVRLVQPDPPSGDATDADRSPAG